MKTTFISLTLVLILGAAIYSQQRTPQPLELEVYSKEGGEPRPQAVIKPPHGTQISIAQDTPEYRQVADLLKSHTQTKRNDYFAEVIADPNLVFDGWNIRVVEVTAEGDATTVKVETRPHFSGPGIVFVAPLLLELYELKGCKLELIESCKRPYGFAMLSD